MPPPPPAYTSSISPPIDSPPSPDPSFPPNDPNASQCHLLGPTALIVQGLMGFFVISSLILKRQLEKRKRKWRVWLGDVGKQLVGQGMVHMLNLLISDVVAQAGNGDRNPCSLYFLNILIDTTFGVIVLYFSLKAFNWLFTTKLGLKGYVSGQYGDPPRMSYWWKQLVPYLLAIISMKVLVVLPLTLPRISATLILTVQSMLAYLGPNVQVIFVLALFPLIMNVFQFCVIDQFVKAGVAGKPDPADDDDDDEDEENGGNMVGSIEVGVAVRDNEGVIDNDIPGDRRHAMTKKGYEKLSTGEAELEDEILPSSNNTNTQFDFQLVTKTSHGDLRRRGSTWDLNADTATTPNIAIGGSFEYARSPDFNNPSSPLLSAVPAGSTLTSVGAGGLRKSSSMEKESLKSSEHVASV